MDNKRSESRGISSLNKRSHKISKPTLSTTSAAQLKNLPPSSALDPQPPVYNINKTDFRHVVQKLTGSPLHHPTSRLHRIRPPPLAAAFPPLSSPPPLPAVHAAAESPVSAYMRYLHTSASSSGFSPPPSPPIPFGCLNSPRSPYPLLLSPSSNQLGFPQLPLSPTVPPMPSPRWRGY